MISTVKRPKGANRLVLVGLIATLGMGACSTDSNDETSQADATSISAAPTVNVTPCTGPGCGDDDPSEEETVENTNPDGWQTPTVPDRAKTDATKARYDGLQPTADQTEAPEVSDELKGYIDDARRDGSDDPFVFGDDDADVVVQVYLDYQCPYCAGAAGEMDPVLKEAAEAGEIRLEYNNYPVLGEHSVLAALGSVAAAEQGKFWEYHDYIYEALRNEDPVDLHFEGVLDVAEEIGIEDLEQFKQTMMADETAESVVADATKAIDGLGIRYVPAYFVGYSFLDIEGDADYARHAIDLELQRAAG